MKLWLNYILMYAYLFGYNLKILFQTPTIIECNPIEQTKQFKSYLDEVCELLTKYHLLTLICPDVYFQKLIFRLD